MHAPGPVWVILKLQKTHFSMVKFHVLPNLRIKSKLKSLKIWGRYVQLMTLYAGDFANSVCACSGLTWSDSKFLLSPDQDWVQTGFKTESQWIDSISCCQLSYLFMFWRNRSPGPSYHQFGQIWKLQLDRISGLDRSIGVGWETSSKVLSMTFINVGWVQDITRDDFACD